MPDSLRLALIQPDTAWENPEANIKKADRMLSGAAESGATVAAFPEMFTTGFSMKAHAIKGAEALDSLSSLASKHNINLLAGVASASGLQGLNKALAYDNSGSLVADYSKMHPFSFADEDKHYSPGPGTAVFKLAGVASSVFICYDLRFPEVFRSVARQVKVIYVLANWPASRHDHWHALLKARAIENQCFVAGVNRTGADGEGIAYAGGSCVYGPFGEEVFLADESEGVYIVDLDISLADSTRSRYPFLKDMRADGFSI